MMRNKKLCLWMRLPVIAYDIASRRKVLGTQRTYWSIVDAPTLQVYAVPSTLGLDRQERSSADRDDFKRGTDFLRILLERGSSSGGLGGSSLPLGILLQQGNINFMAEFVFLGPLSDEKAQKHYNEWRKLTKQTQLQFWANQLPVEQRVSLANLMVDALGRATPSALQPLPSVPTLLSLPLMILGSADRGFPIASYSKEDLLVLEYFKSLIITLIRCGDLQDIVLSTFLQPTNISFFKRFLSTMHYSDVYTILSEVLSTTPSYSGTVAPITTIRNALVKERLLNTLMGFIYGQNQIRGMEHSLSLSSAEFIMGFLLSAPVPLQRTVLMTIAPDCIKCTFDAASITSTSTPITYSLRLKQMGLLTVLCFCVLLQDAEANPTLVSPELASKKPLGMTTDIDLKGRSRSNQTASPSGTPWLDDKDKPLNHLFQYYVEAIASFSSILVSCLRSGTVTAHLLVTLRTLALLLTIRSTPMNTNDSFYGVFGSNMTDSNLVKLLNCFLSGTVNPHVTGYSIPARFASEKAITRNIMLKLCFELERTGSYRNLLELARSNPHNSILHSAIAQILLNTAILGYYSPVLFKFVLQSSKLSDFLTEITYVPPSYRNSFYCFCKGVVQGLINISTGATEAHILSRRLANLPLLQSVYQTENQVILASALSGLTVFQKNSPNDTRSQLVDTLLKDPGLAVYSKNVLEVHSLQINTYDFNHKQFLQKFAVAKSASPSFGGTPIEPSPRTGNTIVTRQGQETGSERSKNWRASTPLPKKRDTKNRRSSQTTLPQAPTLGQPAGALSGSGGAAITTTPSTTSSTLAQSRQLKPRYEKTETRGRITPQMSQPAASMPPTGFSINGPTSNASNIVDDTERYGSSTAPPKQQPLVSSLSLDYTSRMTNPQNYSPLERQYSDKTAPPVMYTVTNGNISGKVLDRAFDSSIKERRAMLQVGSKTEQPRRDSVGLSGTNSQYYAAGGSSRYPYSNPQSSYSVSYGTPDSTMHSTRSYDGLPTRTDSPYPERNQATGRATHSSGSLTRGYTDRSTDRPESK